MENTETVDAPRSSRSLERLVRHREKAAQAWCTETNKNTVMDTELATAFADIMLQETAPLEDLLELAWCIIANAGGGDWKKETQEWQDAAARWRYNYHELLRPNIGAMPRGTANETHE